MEWDGKLQLQHAFAVTSETRTFNGVGSFALSYAYTSPES